MLSFGICLVFSLNNCSIFLTLSNYVLRFKMHAEIEIDKL